MWKQEEYTATELGITHIFTKYTRKLNDSFSGRNTHEQKKQTRNFPNNDSQISQRIKNRKQQLKLN